MDRRPDTRFAVNGDLSIAYQVAGDGPVDLVCVPGFMSHVELNWDYVFIGAFLERLAQVVSGRPSSTSEARACRIARSGPARSRIGCRTSARSWTTRGIEQAALLGVSNGGPLAAMFAATHPERVPPSCCSISGCPGSEPVDPGLDDMLTLVREFWTTGLVLNTVVQHPPDPADAVDAAGPVRAVLLHAVGRGRPHPADRGSRPHPLPRSHPSRRRSSSTPATTPSCRCARAPTSPSTSPARARSSSTRTTTPAGDPRTTTSRSATSSRSSAGRRRPPRSGSTGCCPPW